MFFSSMTNPDLKNPNDKLPKLQQEIKNSFIFISEIKQDRIYFLLIRVALLHIDPHQTTPVVDYFPTTSQPVEFYPIHKQWRPVIVIHLMHLNVFVT